MEIPARIDGAALRQEIQGLLKALRPAKSRLVRGAVIGVPLGTEHLAYLGRANVS